MIFFSIQLFFHLGAKFGCDYASEAPKLLKIAKQLNLNVVGVSFHVGSGCADYPIYSKAIEICRNLFDVGEKLGFKMNLLDIGGGFPGDNDKNIDEVAAIINHALEIYFPSDDVRIISEPGRYFVSSAFTLVTNVYSIKNIASPVERKMIYINDGIYSSFNCLLYDHQVVKPHFLKANKSGQKVRGTIVGPTCE
jgi:ornithine decarboxylase